MTALLKKMSEFLKHNIKNNLKKGARVLGGSPVGAAIEYFASATPLSNYTKGDLDYARQMQFMKDAKPITRNKFLKSKKKNKKGPR